MKFLRQSGRFMPPWLVAVVALVPALADDPPCDPPQPEPCICQCSEPDPPSSDVTWCMLCDDLDCDGIGNNNYFCYKRSTVHLWCNGIDHYCSTTGWQKTVRCCDNPTSGQPSCSDWTDNCHS